LAASIVAVFTLLAAIGLRLTETAGVAQTALLMPSFFGAPPVRLKPGDGSLVSGEIPLTGAEAGAVLHVHRPASGRHPAFIIALGLHPADPNDPRVKALLDGLAERGLAVGLVDSPALDADTLQLDAPNDLVAAFRLMAEQPFVDPDRLGFIGFSVGGSLALLASVDPRIATRVKLVEALGPYASLESVARATLTGSFQTENGSQAWTPDTLTRTAVPENLVELLAPANDRALLLSWLANGEAANQPAPPSLSPDGEIVLRLLATTDGQAFDAAFSSLPAEQTAHLLSLSPIQSLSQLDAPVYLMVDKHDPLIPPVESIRLAQALDGSRQGVYLSQFDLFRHVEPTHFQASPSLLRDVLRLFWQAHAVLERLQG